jgi:uncharacterized SAM-binding protein YcdF (DUF218 family)
MSSRSKIRRLCLSAAMLAVAALAVYFGVVYYDVWRQARTDEAQKADAIVVLGAAQYWGRPSPVLRARLDHALDLYQKGLAPRIITTGGLGEGATFTESEVGREYLSRQGVPAEFVTVETGGQSTAQSAAAVAEIMDRMELRSCIVVSDSYHIYRIKRMLEANGLEVYGSPRGDRYESAWTEAWFYARESLGYMLWRVGIRV